MAKRYWLKTNAHFFRDSHIVYLKSQKNGFEYIYLWQSLLLKCLEVDDESDCGFLRLNEKIPYSPELLSEIFGMNIDVVRAGVDLFVNLGMMSILENGTIYVESVQKMIGRESESAERVRQHRERKKLHALQCNPIPVSLPIQIKNKSKKEDEEIYLTKILESWIDSGLPKHNINTVERNIKKKHIDIIDDIGKDEFIEMIKVYGEILKSDKYYFTHPYSLWDFISRGHSKFLPELEPLTNMLLNKKETPKLQTTDDLLRG